MQGALSLLQCTVCKCCFESEMHMTIEMTQKKVVLKMQAIFRCYNTLSMLYRDGACKHAGCKGNILMSDQEVERIQSWWSNDISNTKHQYKSQTSHVSYGHTIHNAPILTLAWPRIHDIVWALENVT